MPVGTRGTVKGILPEQLERIGTHVVLANTYHLHLRPGADVVRELGGLHAFMGWDRPILTDSGGYQIFSLRDITHIDEDGATLKSIVDGTPIRLTPEATIEIEHALGADIIMALDHCPADPTHRIDVEIATERTTRWLERCVHTWRDSGSEQAGQALFGIVQGGAFEDLRRRSLEATLQHDLPGYAIGGVSVGEERSQSLKAVESCASLLPEDKPRYLMGVGTPIDFLDMIAKGIDLFDCVTPTRHGRNHQAYTSFGRINLRNQRWRTDRSPLDESCDCPTCARFSRGYLRHLAQTGEMLAGMLLSVHNVRFFHRLMEDARAAIRRGTFGEFMARTKEALGASEAQRCR